MRAHHQPERTDQPSRVRQGARRSGEACHPPRSTGAILALQRTVGNAAVASLLDDRASTAVHEVLRSPGNPLDPPVRQEMEARLGADFSDVRVHTGPVAQRSAAGVAARAYTSGSHVVLGAAGVDRHTLAHELTHVIQQRSGPVSGTDTGTGLRISDPTDRHERAAESNAARVMAGSPPVDRPEIDRVAAGPVGGVLPEAGTRGIRKGPGCHACDRPHHRAD